MAETAIEEQNSEGRFLVTLYRIPHFPATEHEVDGSLSAPGLAKPSIPLTSVIYHQIRREK